MDTRTGSQTTWENIQDIFGFGTTGRANQFSAEQAAMQRNWETEMSNTQYQRAIADMEAAGLNPGLAYQQGGATSHSGASASAANPYTSPMLPNLVNSAANMINAIGNVRGGKKEQKTALQKAMQVAKILAIKTSAK